MATILYNCQLCELFASSHMKDIVHHIKLVHAHEPRFRIICGNNGCTRAFNNFHTYKSHIYTKHRDALCVRPRQQSPAPEDISPFYSAMQDEEEGESYMEQREEAQLFLF